MNEDHYLLDAVTLFRMTPQQRASEFLRTYCRVPTEILFEAKDLPEYRFLAELEYKVTTAVLDHVRTVMSTVQIKDKLIDLYTGKGNGDVLLLASALALTAAQQPNLFPDRWIIASDDEAVRAKASELSIEVCTTAQLQTLIGAT